MKIQRLLAGSILTALIALGACKEKKKDPTPVPTGEKQYFVGMEAGTGTDVLLPVESLTEGVLSPVGKGIEQPAWMTYTTSGNTLVVSGYATDNVLTGYRVINGQLTNIGSLVTELQTYVYG